jgi:hypothetical protein
MNTLAYFCPGVSDNYKNLSLKLGVLENLRCQRGRSRRPGENLRPTLATGDPGRLLV